MKPVFTAALAGVCLLLFLFLGDGRQSAAAAGGESLPLAETQVAPPDARDDAGTRALSTDSPEQAKEQLTLAARYVLLGAVVCGVELHDEETTGMLLPLMLKYRESADSLLEHFTASLDACSPEVRALMEDEQKMSAAKERCPEILRKRKDTLEYFSR